ncbi:MAG: FAD:protein FMN transferase [Planctomycetota bacterium]|nr:FAD:protein FMN transferase [Planctomycetota bacterium]
MIYSLTRTFAFQIFILWVIAACLNTSLGCSLQSSKPLRTTLPAESVRFQFREVAMGCEMRIELFAQTSSQAQILARAAFDRVHSLDEVLSDYRASSQVGRLPTDAMKAFAISPDLCEALEKSIRISRATEGCFDATIGVSSQLWRQARKDGILPSTDAIARANEIGGWDEITVDPCENHRDSTIRFLRSGIRLDFGGIGKGIAAQAALDTLRSLGTSVAMCSLAGDIACGDAPTGSDGWLIDVESGIEGVPSCRLVLHNQCVSTSGDESQHLDTNGIRYSHVLDPRTGAAVTRRIAATVVCRDGAIADALATALCVGGPELLDRSTDIQHALGDFQARVTEITSSGRESTTMTLTSGWNALLAWNIIPRDQVSQLALAEAGQTAMKVASDSLDLKEPLPK